MLVLVTELIEAWFGKIKHKLESIIAIVLLSVATFCFAQSSSMGFETVSPAQDSQTEKSVLELVEGKPSKTEMTGSESLNVAANGSARIDANSSGNATFTSQTLSPAPEPPQDLLVPANPSESTFVRPFANELRGETISSGDVVSPTEDNPIQQDPENDGGQATGTFATTNQSFQDQPSNVGSQFADPPQERFRFQAPPSNAGRFGQPAPPNTREFNSGAPSSSQTPSLPNIGSPISDQPTAWRNAPSTEPGQSSNGQPESAQMQSSAPNVRSFNAPDRFSSRGQLPPIRSSNPVPKSYNAQAYGQLDGRDSNVSRTGFTQPAVSPKTSTDLAKLLIARYSPDNVSDALPGQPTKLIEMLRQPISAPQRRAMVNQYWETYYDWANYISAKHYEQWLTRIPTSVSSSDKAMLEAALAVASNNTLAAEIQLGKSQSGLQQFMPNRRSTDLLPLPSDLPLIQRYKTNYELYRSRQMMPVSLLGIDQMLPKTLELIQLRAEAVKVTKNAADQVHAALSAGGQSVMPVLESGRIWRAAERDLVASVVSYNQAIGDYSLSVTGGYQPPEEVVAMLIAKPQKIVAQASSVFQRQEEQFNSNAQANRRFGNQPQQPSRSANSVLERPAGEGGQSRLPASSGTGGATNFNLGAGAYRSNPSSTSNGGLGGSNSGSHAAPEVAPIDTNRFGGRPAAKSGSGFGPSLPR